MSSQKTPDSNAVPQARLEHAGEAIPLSPHFIIGRSSKCAYMIPETKVSREHSVLQFNQTQKHWLLTDLGSTNGTYLNGTRISRPHVLKNGDVIRISDRNLTFVEDRVMSDSATLTSASEDTLIAVDSVTCWLLVADIKGSSRLSQEMPQGELSEKIRIWLKECETIIQAAHGAVNDLLGDGFLAFWRTNPKLKPYIVNMLEKFQELKSTSGLPFRVILHHGTVEIGGGMSSGLEKLAGAEVNYVFKMEKAASRAGVKVSLTRSANDQLSSLLKTRDLGDFTVSGFEGGQKLFEPEFS